MVLFTCILNYHSFPACYHVIHFKQDTMQDNLQVSFIVFSVASEIQDEKTTAGSLQDTKDTINNVSLINTIYSRYKSY